MHRQRDTEVLLAEVTGVDVVGHRVLLGKRSVAYDYLVLATGAQHRYFGHEAWERLAPELKTLTDATTIRRQILLAFEEAEAEADPATQQALLTFVIVGGGPTGVELAGAIAGLAHKSLVRDFRHIHPASDRVLLVEAAPRLLAAFPETLARNAQQALERVGVEVRVQAPVEQVDAEGVVIRGQRILARTVIWAAGVQASPVGAWLGTQVDWAGRVMVERDLTVPGHPEIFVIGDTASLTEHGKPLPGVAPVAMQEGHFVAKLIRRCVAGATERLPFHYRDKGNLATVGRSFAIADLGLLKLSGFIAWVAWLLVHITYLIGFRNRLLVMIQWAWAYLTSQRGTRLITESCTETPPVPITRQAPGGARSAASAPIEERASSLSQ